MTSDQTIEQEIQAKGKTAPRVTPTELQANITSEHYFTAMDGILGASRQGTGLNVVDSYPAQTGVAKNHFGEQGMVAYSANSMKSCTVFSSCHDSMVSQIRTVV